RQPAIEMIRMTSGGAAAAPMRLLMNTAPWAAPRSVNGNHLAKLREMFGYAPASPTPKRNLATRSDGKLQARPLAVVNADHHSTIRISVLRGPIRSPNHPLGISNAAHAKVKALKIQPIWTVVSPSSDRIAGAEEAMHTRSMNVITDSTQAKYKRLYRARVGGMRDPGHGASKTRRGSSLIALAINVVDVPVPWCGRRRVFHRHLDD